MIVVVHNTRWETIVSWMIFNHPVRTGCFGDGGKGRVLGIGSLIILGLSKLNTVLLVEGLIVNLIVMSQMCVEDLLVQNKG